MIHVNFIASDDFEIGDFDNYDVFLSKYPTFQTIVLNNEIELVLLLKLLGITRFERLELKDSIFPYYYNISEDKLPFFDDNQFDQFYEFWIHKSKRENTMDEYGGLIFLTGYSLDWSKLKHQLITVE